MGLSGSIELSPPISRERSSSLAATRRASSAASSSSAGGAAAANWLEEEGPAPADVESGAPPRREDAAPSSSSIPEPEKCVSGATEMQDGWLQHRAGVGSVCRRTQPESGRLEVHPHPPDSMRLSRDTGSPARRSSDDGSPARRGSSDRSPAATSANFVGVCTTRTVLQVLSRSPANSCLHCGPNRAVSFMFTLLGQIRRGSAARPTTTWSRCSSRRSPNG